MVNPNEDYEQDKVKGEAKQTIIIDERETGETDELDPNFSDPDGSATDSEIASEQDSSDDEALDDPGLNRDADDDLSLNKPEDDLF